jgi:hypothetical protein
MMDAAANTERPCREWASDLWRIGFIMLLALAPRAWILAHTEALSRDGLGFIRFALQLEDPPSSPEHPERQMTRAEVLKASLQAPGYSASILAVSWPVRWVMGGTTCQAMTISAQLASLLASLLLVIPMYFFGKLAFDRQTAFVGTMVFQVLPATSIMASDGLSDNLFLCLAMMSTWLIALGLRGSGWAWFGAGGMMIGLTYLVRPEGLIVGLATCLVLAWNKLCGEVTWGGLLKRCFALTAGAALIMAPYMATIGRLTNKPTALDFLNWLLGEKMTPSWITTEAPVPEPAINLPIAEFWPHFGLGMQPTSAWATKALAKEFCKASFYVLPAFAALGLYVAWPRLRRDSAGLLIVTLGLCHALVLWRVAKGAGYVAERHTLLIVLCSSYFMAASFPAIGEKLALLPRLRRLGSAQMWSAIVAFAVVAVCVPAAMKSLHVNRAGHRAAGLWLAANQQPGSYVLDPFAWGEFYSGHMRLNQSASPPPRTVYTVFERQANMHLRLHELFVARYFAERSQVVYHWPENAPVESAKVFVYRWEGDNFDQLWGQAYFEFLQQKEEAMRRGPAMEESR